METINHFQCFDYMIDSANDILDEDFIKNTHKILKTNTSDSRISWFNVGEYKSRKNMVGDLITTPPEKVKSTIEKLLNEYNKKQTVSRYFRFSCKVRKNTSVSRWKRSRWKNYYVQRMSEI